MMKSILSLFAGLSIAGVLASCTPTSSSTVIDGAEAGSPWTGKVVVSQSPLPDDVEHQVIANVEAAAQGGYGSVESLYPLLADEARKVGANSVIGVKGGRRLAPGSWSAPYASGTAVRVEDPDEMSNVVGRSY